MIPLAAILSACVGLVTLGAWRSGLLAIIVIGVLQDAFRKLTPGAPAVYIIWSMAMYLLVVLVATLGGSLPPVRTIFLGDVRVRAAWTVFGILILLQLLNALLRWGTPAVPILGAVFYLGPALTMLVACGYAASENRVRQFLGFYALILIPTCLTVYLSPFWRDAMPVLRDVGTFVGREILIYDVGTVLASYSGILRSGEVSSWHAATAAIFIATLSHTARRNPRRVVAGLLIVLLIGVIILTGRRKMLMALTLFFLTQWALLAWFRKGLGRVVVLVFLVGAIGSFSFTLLEPASEGSLYVARSKTVFGDAAGRLGLAFRLMQSAYHRSAGLGLGAGSASQGGRYAGIDQSELVGGSSEAGLGLFMVELGVPGLLAIGWLLFVFLRRLLGGLRALLALNERLFLYQVAFLSFLFANMMTFIVATQIYGDLFVQIILGTVAGFALRVNSLVTRGAGPGASRVTAESRT